jgi:WD40 repeat protein
VQEAKSGFDVACVALRDPSKMVHITNSRFDERLPSLSPDGRWVAYASNETGRDEVFVTDFPSGARKWQVSRSGGQNASWRGDSRELYFNAPDGAAAVAVNERNGTLELGSPEHLAFAKDSLRLDGRVFSPDGRQFLVERYDSAAVPEPIRLVRGWRRVVEKWAGPTRQSTWIRWSRMRPKNRASGERKSHPRCSPQLRQSDTRHVNPGNQVQ